MSIWDKVGIKKVMGSPMGGAKKLLAVDTVTSNFGWMGAVVKSMMPSSVKAGRVETFAHAMSRQGVTEEDLDRIYTNHVIKFWICVIMFFAGWLVALSYLLTGQWLALFPVFAFSGICFSQMFAASFRAYQVGNRKFCDVSEWFNNRSVWLLTSFDLPPPPKPIVTKPRSVVVVKKAAPPSSTTKK